jgi:glycosyltransferase involved in cell wall biosynthesis
MHKLATHYGVNERVMALAATSDDALAQLYRGAVATLVPSLVEGFGLPALESIACGTPPIYWSGCDSVAEICRESGLAVEASTDVDAWQSAMSQAVLHRPVVADADISARYDWTKTADRVASVLERFVHA